MAYQFAKIAATVFFRGHRIDTVESPMQIVFMVDENAGACYWSMEDARRFIRGQQTKSLPVDVRHWFR